MQSKNYCNDNSRRTKQMSYYLVIASIKHYTEKNEHKQIKILNILYLTKVIPGFELNVLSYSN